MKNLFLAILLTVIVGPVAAQEPLRVVARPFEPFSYLEDGEPAGLEYEILNYFAKSQGRQLEITWVETFAELLPRFDQGGFDIATGTITITPAREEIYDFTESYFPVRIHVIEPKGQKVSNLDELKGETLVANAGTTYEELLLAVPDAKFVYAPDELAAFELLARGEARAGAVDSVLGLVFLPDFPNLHMTLAVSEPQDYGFVVSTGSPLAGQLNKHIAELKLAGIYFRLLEDFLGKEAVEMVQAAKE